MRAIVPFGDCFKMGLHWQSQSGPQLSAITIIWSLSTCRVLCPTLLQKRHPHRKPGVCISTAPSLWGKTKRWRGTLGREERDPSSNLRDENKLKGTRAVAQLDAVSQAPSPALYRQAWWPMTAIPVLSGDRMTRTSWSSWLHDVT